ncbi:hypothetical protein HGA91_05600 [candidate division WWE3 bacterium]|nr:hypothetical protein [candidate division WWE3 bacterium]
MSEYRVIFDEELLELWKKEITDNLTHGRNLEALVQINSSELLETEATDLCFRIIINRPNAGGLAEQIKMDVYICVAVITFPDPSLPVLLGPLDNPDGFLAWMLELIGNAGVNNLRLSCIQEEVQVPAEAYIAID